MPCGHMIMNKKLLNYCICASAGVYKFEIDLVKRCILAHWVEAWYPYHFAVTVCFNV